MKQCTPKQVEQIRAHEEREQATVDPAQLYGCEVPQSNSAYAEDHGLNGPDAETKKKIGGGVALAAPGSATEKAMDAVGNWIENGFDGEQDSEWEQLARAIPGTLALPAAACFGGAVDALLAFTPWDPFGD